MVGREKEGKVGESWEEGGEGKEAVREVKGVNERRRDCGEGGEEGMEKGEERREEGKEGGKAIWS